VYTNGGGGGGSNGSDRARGGNGGAVRWFGPGDLFDGSRFIGTDGGYGAPNGDAGVTQANGAPGDVAIRGGRLSFVPHAPSATAHEVLLSLAGGPWRQAGVVPGTSASVPRAVPCLATAVAVAASAPALGWDGPASTAVRLPKRALPGTGCTKAPRVSLPTTTVTLAALRARFWELSAPGTLRGAGYVSVALVAGPDRRVVVPFTAAVGALRDVSFTLPTWARGAGTYRLEVTARAPRGSASVVVVGRLRIVG
jgi:hypothetical protein